MASQFRRPSSTFSPPSEPQSLLKTDSLFAWNGARAIEHEKLALFNETVTNVAVWTV